jgi:hypothetical protein
MYLILSISVIVFYFLMQMVELASFGSRVAGRISHNLALGTTIHHTMYVGSRFFLVPFLPVLAYLVETGITLNNYLLLVIISLFSALIMSILVLYKVDYLQIFFQIVFRNNKNNYLPTALLKTLFSSNKSDISFNRFDEFSYKNVIKKKVILSFIAYSFLVTSFFIAFTLAIIFPEYRLTLSQSTSVFHGFGAVIVAFYLDPMLSKSIDRLNDKSWIVNAYSILLGRVLSYLISCILFILVLIINLY